MGWFGGTAKKVVEILEELSTTKARMEFLDKEVHRMLEEFKSLLNAWVQREDERNLRLTTLEAKVAAILEKAAHIEAREGAREGVREAIKERQRELDSGGGPKKGLSRGKPRQTKGDGGVTSGNKIDDE